MLTLLVGFALLVVSLSARFDPYRSLSKSTGAAGSMPGGSTRPPSVTPRRARARWTVTIATIPIVPNRPTST